MGLPGFNGDAVEPAERGEESGGGQQSGVRLWRTRPGGDDGGGTEEEADGNFFCGEERGRAAGKFYGAMGLQEINRQQRGERKILTKNWKRHVARNEQQQDECGGGDAGEQNAGVAGMEMMAGFESGGIRLAGVERTGIQETIGDVENPNAKK